MVFLFTFSTVSVSSTVILTDMSRGINLFASEYLQIYSYILAPNCSVWKREILQQFQRQEHKSLKAVRCFTEIPGLLPNYRQKLQCCKTRGWTTWSGTQTKNVCKETRGPRDNQAGVWKSNLSHPRSRRGSLDFCSSTARLPQQKQEEQRWKQEEKSELCLLT